MAQSGSVDCTHDGYVANVVFNQPLRHNAMSLAMWKQLDTTVHNLIDDDNSENNTRVVVFTGAGDKAFVSGADISEFKSKRSGADEIENYNRVSSDGEKAVYDCPLPTVAKINGYCMGGGVGIAMSCDIRICSDNASFALPAGRLGLGYGFDGVCKLLDVLGPTATSELFYFAKKLGAQEALELGLVSQVVPAADLDRIVDELAATIAAQAPLTLKAYKAALLEYRKSGSERNVDDISQMVLDCYTSEDYAEGQAAFREKRQPVFKGI